MLKALWAQRPTRPAESSQTELNIDGRVVIWRRSARRKRSLALKFDRQGGLVAMTPIWTTHEELKMFVRARAAWIGQQAAQLEALEARRVAEQGRYVYFQGQRLEVVCVQTERNVIEHFERVLQVGSRQPPSEKRLKTRLASWLRQQAEEYLSMRLTEISGQTGLVASGLQVKTYTARWGSCRHDGVIQLNWKLIMAPCGVIDYVILHELCHLRYFNHSAAFWSLVARYEPDYRSQRRWLKENGQLLLTATV